MLTNTYLQFFMGEEIYKREFGIRIADIIFPRYGFVIKGMSDAIRKKLMCK